MANGWKSVLQYLGISKVTPRPGYAIPDKHWPARQICVICGAQVPPSQQEQHTAWHESQLT